MSGDMLDCGAEIALDHVLPNPVAMQTMWQSRPCGKADPVRFKQQICISWICVPAMTELRTI
jgi:hypothetical protein